MVVGCESGRASTQLVYLFHVSKRRVDNPPQVNNLPHIRTAVTSSSWELLVLGLVVGRQVGHENVVALLDQDSPFTTF
jgi:hypothetical protein